MSPTLGRPLCPPSVRCRSRCNTRQGRGAYRLATTLSILLLAPAGCQGPEPLPEPWTARAPSPIPRFEAAGADIDGRFYLFGGFVDTLLHTSTRVDRYDPRDDSWTRLADMPTPVTHLAAAVDGGTVWFAGGFEGDHPGRATDAVWLYDVEGDAWQSGPALPAPRGAGVTVRVGRELHYIGGFDATRDSTPGDHWVLDLARPEEWTALATMPGPRGHAGAAVVDDRIYVVGGQVRHDDWPEDLPLVHSFDVVSREWRAEPPLPTGRSHAEPGTFVHQGLIYAFGGRDNGNERWATNDAVRFDPATGRWSVSPLLPIPMLAPFVRFVGDTLYVATGSAVTWNRPQDRVMARPSGLDSLEP